MESTSPAQLDTVSQPEAPAASRYSLRWLFFPLALLYHELLLRAFDSSTVFFDAALAPTALTALGLGRPKPVGRNLHFTHGIMLNTVFHLFHPFLNIQLCNNAF